MKRLEDFRIYYNHTIHPELLRLERKRLRLLRLLFFSTVLVLALLAFELYVGILAITLFMMIPIGFYIAYLLYRIRQFVQTFKPNIMNLILDFIDDSINYGTLKYDSKRSITKQQFFASRLFKTSASYFKGEDYIEGKIGSLDFELCELFVREMSPVRNQMDYVFKGVFLHAVFSEDLRGEVAIWPREYRQFLTRSIKAFTWSGAKNVDHEILNNAFRERFITYATEHTYVAGILSEPMQQALVNYCEQTGKEVYISVIGKDIYTAITEPRNILEPNIFKSNLSFELVREFFEDIYVILSIIEDFDKMH
ncbi:MAG: DUF3137 domain-containing protein [Bacteroidota bacterium]